MKKQMTYHNFLKWGAAAVLLAIAGCRNDDTQLWDDTDQPTATETDVMSFNVAHPYQTRATSTDFEANDRIGLFICESNLPLEVSGNYVNNATLTFDGNRWTPANPIYWNNGTYNVYGYYPYTSSVGSVDEMPFSVSTDQSGTTPAEGEMDGYEQSDFLWAGSENVTAGNGQVSLQFNHRMSRLLIKLVKGEDYEGDELPANAEVYIHNTVPTATIDLSVGIVTRDPYGTARTIRAKSLGNHVYSAIVVPQRLDNRQPLVEVVMEGVSYLYESKFQFKNGIQHSVQLVISKNPNQIKIEIGGELENWDE